MRKAPAQRINILHKDIQNDILLFLGETVRHFLTGQLLVLVEIISQHRQIVDFHIDAILAVAIANKQQVEI